MNIFLSDRIGSDRIPYLSSTEIVLGKAHYSWKIIANLYEEALKKIGYSVSRIASPDIYQSDEARKCVGIDSDDIHIAVKPIEHIRPMFGVHNLFVCGWEFPEFSTSAINGSPVYNQIAGLKRADAVVCWSEFTARNLRAYGIRQAVALPPPIISLATVGREPIESLPVLKCVRLPNDQAIFLRFAEIRERYNNMFLAVLNPYDQRKNLRGLIKGFMEFRTAYPEDSSALLIKLVIDNVGTTTFNIIEILSKNYGISADCDDLYFLGENLNGSQLASLYEECDFYYCSSSAEGLNLPLIEAMGCGIVPISSSATAMADYINHDNAIVLPVSRVRTTEDFSALGESVSLTHFLSDLADLTKAFSEASCLSRGDRVRLSGAARKTVNIRYGLDRFQRDFDRLVRVQ